MREQAATTAAPRSLETTRTRRILIADDEQPVRDFLAKLLRARGCSIDTCTSGPETLELLQSKEFDVVVLDLELRSHPSGMEIIRRRPMPNQHARYVVLTGKGTDDRRDQAMLLGAAAFLDKPSHARTIIAAIEGSDTAECSDWPEGLAAPNDDVVKLRTLMSDLEANFAQADLRIDAVASRNEVPRQTAFKLFRRHLLQTPAEFLLERRLREVEKRLLGTDESVKAIALSCGFHDSSELDHAFRRLKGCTPSALRARR